MTITARKGAFLLLAVLPALASAEASEFPVPKGRAAKGPDAQQNVSAVARELANARTPDDVIAKYIASRPGDFLAPLGGAQSGAADVAAEALQILGQIVVDRATDRAYQLAKERLESLLHCRDKATKFTRTCEVVLPLRVQELASSGQALEAALLADVLNELSPAVPEGLSKDAWDAFRTSLLPMLLHPTRSLTPAAASNLAQQVVALGIRPRSGEKFCKLDTPARALQLVAAGVLQCQASVAAGGSLSTLASCPVGLVMENLAAAASCGDDKLPPAAMTVARAIAQNVIAAVTVTVREGGARAQLEHATDALFLAACIGNGDTDCDEASTRTAKWLRLARRASHALLEQDTNMLVAVAFDALVTLDEIVKDEQKAGERRRGLSLVAALLEYTATYQPNTEAAETTTSPAQPSPHERRTQILKSLTQEMTNRTGRAQDAIFSLGGTLRGVGGLRFASGARTFWGPLALPLGIGYQSATGKRGWGFHGELGVVDLGQYVSFSKGGEVQKPKLEDVLTVTGGIGAYYGKDMPLTIALTGGYSPHYQESASGSRGAWNLGIGVGIYVPLFDLN